MCKSLLCSVVKIVILILICAVLWFSKMVLVAAFGLDACPCKENRNGVPPVCTKTADSKLSDETPVGTGMEHTGTICNNPCPNRDEKGAVNYTTKIKCSDKKYVNLYQVMCIVFIVSLAVTLFALASLLVKDDSGIRYEKLDMLAKVREKLFEGVDYKEDNKEKNQAGKKEYDSATTTSVTTEKSIKAELVKKYMDCIVEV